MTAARAVLAALAVVAAAPALAAEQGSVQGVGRITAGGGWRLVPNDHWRAGAAEQGTPEATPSIGGPHAFISGGYGALDYLDVGLDLYVGGERHTLETLPTYTAVSYGVAVAVRFMKADFLVQGLTPMAGVGLGPTICYVGRDDGLIREIVTTGFSAMGGISWRLTHAFGLWLEYRFLLARGFAPEIGRSINMGGSFFGLGVTFYLESYKGPAETPLISGPSMGGLGLLKPLSP